MRPSTPIRNMIDYIAANPGEVRFGSTGPGGLPSVVTAMINGPSELDVIFGAL
jgi:hypothetical protein